MCTQVLLTATVQSHIWHFHRPLIRVIQALGHEVHVAARDDLSERGLALKAPDKVFNIPFSRVPLHRDNLKAYRMLVDLIEGNHYGIIHCNTPVAGVITRTAARKARQHGTKLLYEAHGFHFHHGAPLLNWVMYYPIEKVMAPWTDSIVTVNLEDYEMAKKKRFMTDIRHVHGVGVDPNSFRAIDIQEKNRRRNQLGIGEDDVIILNIGELNDNKNQATIIRAMRFIVDTVPQVRLLIAGSGPNHDSLVTLIHDLGLNTRISLIGYCTDLSRLLPTVDILVSSSIREGLPLNILEAMACGIPVIASRNRGHNELIENGVSGLLFSHDNPWELAESILRLQSNLGLREQIKISAHEKISPYLLKNALKEMMVVYDQMLGNQFLYQAEPCDHEDGADVER